MALNSSEYLFSRNFMQAAYIALLEELKDQLSHDLKLLEKQLPAHADELEIIRMAQQKITIANSSIEKLRKGF